MGARVLRPSKEEVRYPIPMEWKGRKALLAYHGAAPIIVRDMGRFDPGAYKEVSLEAALEWGLTPGFRIHLQSEREH